MIGYVTLGTNDMKRSAAFYDKLLAEIGAKRMMEQETFIVWGNSPSQAALSVTKPFDGKPATAGNGSMAAFRARSWQEVDDFHAAALAHGVAGHARVAPTGAGCQSTVLHAGSARGRPARAPRLNQMASARSSVARRARVRATDGGAV